VGVRKARLPWLTQALLGVLAGAFIGLGALMFTLVASDASLGFAAQRLLGGVAFSLGLLLVAVAGAELFTGNNLIAMAWAGGHVRTGELLWHWALVCLANLVGAAGLALLVWLSGHTAMNGGAIARAALAIAAAKAELSWTEAFFRGVLCSSAWRCGWALPDAAWSTRRWPSCSRSRPSSPPASSTRSPTCTSSRSRCCWARHWPAPTSQPTWRR
jgi:formate transporter